MCDACSVTDPISDSSDERLDALVKPGFDALRKGDRRRAVAVCRDALRRNPDLAAAHYLAALIALDSGDRQTALKAFEQVVRLDPQHAASWAQLARLFLTSGSFVKAEGCLVNAVNTQRGDAAVMDLIGTVFRLAGNFAASRDWHRRAVEAAPRQVAFLINLANNHLYSGAYADAERLLRECQTVEPGNAQLHWLLAGVRKATSSRHIDEMRDLVATETRPRAIAYLEYAIGKECEDLEHWASAGQAFGRGAAARRKTVLFDEAADIALFEAAAEEFTPEWLASKTPGPADASPIFIVGEPRTGTTLLDRILATHSAVSSAGELRHLGFAIRRVTGLDEPRQFTAELVQAAAAADSGSIGEAYLESTAGLRDSPRLVDKLPPNYLYLPLILAALPGARILHLVRDPMDTCFAIYKQLFADAYLYSYDLGELARHYVRYHQLLATWRERFPGRFLDVSYERLVQDPEVVVRDVLAYLDLNWEESCLRYYEIDAATATASASQVREAPHTRSIGRWKHYAERLLPVREILGEAGIPAG